MLGALKKYNDGLISYYIIEVLFELIDYFKNDDYESYRKLLYIHHIAYNCKNLDEKIITYFKQNNICDMINDRDITLLKNTLTEDEYNKDIINDILYIWNKCDEKNKEILLKWVDKIVEVISMK